MLRILVADSFTDHPYSGNPAGVCLLDKPVSAEWMQAIAAEMRHSETAFLVPVENSAQDDEPWDLEPLSVDAPGPHYLLRWFTPAAEVDLCGHATLASAHVLRDLGMVPAASPVQFATRSGRLSVEPEGDRLRMDFPASEVKATEFDARVEDILDARPVFVGKSRFDHFIEVESAEVVRTIAPDLPGIIRLGSRGMVVTAQGEGEYDAVSRFFAPGVGVPEDPVTGSAHCAIGPYWAEKLGKTEVRCFQASSRGGELTVRVRGDRVDLIGRAVTVIKGELCSFD